jgi:hypothetical protein
MTGETQDRAERRAQAQANRVSDLREVSVMPGPEIIQ